MKATVSFWASLCLLLPIAGCAETTAVPLAPDDHTTWGFRVYEPKPLLVVAEGGSKIVFVPNYSRPYAVRFTAFLAKNKAKITTENGLVKDIDTDMDTTGIISFLQQVAKDAMNPTGKASVADLPESKLYGIYEFIFETDGSLLGLRRVRTDVPFSKRS